ncbi:polyamine ABC transporter permease [Aeromicrobium sp. PE09-221]|uniref:ABC transporter permease n=1 Tax=Aeromicrobium sp. PE09-221 TaxID=1898043 RepID=UPI000B6B6D22|nr:ABC transporter permease [Aeromicrobium sp. PE09-221]OUZ11175.1 polyamine ABC transporter permease [Aeromicrobium sp. PE09-221]
MNTFKWSSSRVLLVGFCGLVGVLLMGPTLIVVPLSFTSEKSFRFPPEGWSTQWYENFFTDPNWYESALLSVRVGLAVAVLATVLGTAAAVALSTGRGAWRGPANGFMLAPMIVPGVITAVGIYYVFLNFGLTQGFWGFVLAHTVLALPFVVVAVSASLNGLDKALVTAAWSLGANRWAAFRQITLPLIAPGILTGALFAFLTSFDEAIVSLFLSGPFARTLPIQIFQSVTADIDPTIAAASTMLLATTGFFMVVLGVITVSRNRR